MARMRWTCGSSRCDRSFAAMKKSPAMRGFLWCAPCTQRTLRDALDLRPEPGQLLLDVLVATVEMVDAVDRGLAIGDQPGEDQRSRRAQVGRHHRRAAELRHAANDRGVALDTDVSAEPLQFLHVH